MNAKKWRERREKVTLSRGRPEGYGRASRGWTESSNGNGHQNLQCTVARAAYGTLTGNLPYPGHHCQLTKFVSFMSVRKKRMGPEAIIIFRA